MVDFRPSYEILFTLLVPDPFNGLVDWEMEKAIEAYVSPFMEQVAHLSDFHISSQILYHRELKIEPFLSEDFKSFYFKEDQLAHFIHSGDWSLDSTIVSRAPFLHFVLYVPKQEQSPLYIRSGSDASNQASRIGFLVPQWGGVQILNVPRPSNPSSQPSASNKPSTLLLTSEGHLRPILAVFLSHLRHLLGLYPVDTPCSVLAHGQPLTGLAPFEAYRLTLAWTMRNLGKAQSSYASMLRMIHLLTNIPIQEHVAQKVPIGHKCGC